MSMSLVRAVIVATLVAPALGATPLDDKLLSSGDVAEIRLGMTPHQVRVVLKGLKTMTKYTETIGPSFTFDISPGNFFRGPTRILSIKASSPDNVDVVEALFSPPAGSEQVFNAISSDWSARRLYNPRMASLWHPRPMASKNLEMYRTFAL